MMTSFFGTIQEFHCFEELCTSTKRALIEHAPLYEHLALTVDDIGSIGDGSGDYPRGLWTQFLPAVSKRLTDLTISAELLTCLFFHGKTCAQNASYLQRLQRLTVYSDREHGWTALGIEAFENIAEACSSLTSLSVSGSRLSTTHEHNIMRLPFKALTELSVCGRHRWDAFTATHIGEGEFDKCFAGLKTLKFQCVAPHENLDVRRGLDMAPSGLDRIFKRYNGITSLHLSVNALSVEWVIRNLLPLASSLKQLWLRDVVHTKLPVMRVAERLGPLQALTHFGFVGPVRVHEDDMTDGLVKTVTDHPHLQKLCLKTTAKLDMIGFLVRTATCTEGLDLDVAFVPHDQDTAVSIALVDSWIRAHQASRQWLMTQLTSQTRAYVLWVCKDDEATALRMLLGLLRDEIPEAPLHLTFGVGVDIKAPDGTRVKWTALRGLIDSLPQDSIVHIKDPSGCIDYAGLDRKTPFLERKSSISFYMDAGKSLFDKNALDSLFHAGGAVKLFINVKLENVRGLRLAQVTKDLMSAESLRLVGSAKDPIDLRRADLRTNIEYPNNCPLSIRFEGDCLALLDDQKDFDHLGRLVRFFQHPIDFCFVNPVTNTCTVLHNSAGESWNAKRLDFPV